MWDTIIHKKEWRGEFHNKKKNGELYWELASISPIINETGEVTNFLAVKEDITHIKKMTEELISARNKDLSQILLKKYGISFFDRGRGSNNLLGKVGYAFIAVCRILKKGRIFN